jgi:hypothetical protein
MKLRERLAKWRRWQRAKHYLNREVARTIAVLHPKVQRVDAALLRAHMRLRRADIPNATGVTEKRYVAFIDILGFAARITTDFDTAKATYEEFASNIAAVESVDWPSDVIIRVVSDSIVVVATEFASIVRAVRELTVVAQWADCLVRGGIAYGRHSERIDLLHTYVVSEPLVHAVRTEKEIRRPCVAFHSSVLIPDSAWKFNCDSFLRPILFYDGVWMVNPFNMFWGTSAAGRVEAMKDAHPEHSEKFDWFLGLYKRVASRGVLWPEQFTKPRNDSEPNPES